MDTNWGKGSSRRPARARTVQLRGLDDGDLQEMADALAGAVAALRVNDSLATFASGVDWQKIHRSGVADLAITPDVVRDALSLFRLTDMTTSLRQSLEWWQRLAAAVQKMHGAIASEQARRAGEERS
jgi:hypothetical protein